MKNLIIILFCLISIDSLSNDSIKHPDRIKIEYYNHWYPFGKQGLYYIKEEINITKKSDNFVLINYSKVEKELKGDSTLKHYSNKVYNNVIPSIMIDRLINEFSTNHEPIVIDSLDKIDFLHRITWQKIKKIAKLNDYDWYFEDNDKEDNDSIIKYIKSYAVFDTFTNEKQNICETLGPMQKKRQLLR